MMKKLIAGLTLTLLCFTASNALAVLVDFYDNTLAPDGVYGLLYANYYHADEITDSSGDKAVDVDLTASVSIARALAFKTIGGIHFAYQAILPFGEVKETKLFDESSSGIGDITVGPAVYLYSDEAKGTYLSYWFYITAPTGEWDEDQAINLGENHWYFQHQLAYNKMMGPFVYDMNLNYYQHTKEDDTKTQAPDRIEVEASLGYALSDKLTVGVNGGFYRDLGKTKVAGVKQADSQAERWQFGPSLSYALSERLGLNLRWTHDIYAENDTKGDDVYLRLSYAF
jgi:hypothetical protein